MSEVHLLVTCTKRKRRPAAPALMLRSVDGKTAAARAGRWLDRLRRGGGEGFAVEDLYAGDHWSVVRSLAGATAGPGRRVRVWVCSAGYGLLAWGSRVVPYAATFSPGQPDSVARADEEPARAAQGWWDRLAAWEGPTPGTPRTVRDLVRGASASLFLVALSAPYLAALAADLRQAAACLPDPDCLAVLSAGAEAPASLAELLVPCSARLQPLVGGARISLNVRLARFALQQAGPVGPRRSVLRTLFGRLLDQQPRRALPARSAMTDEQVRAYLRAALREDAGQRPTRLLARLRGQGRACEQARFVTLFRQIEEEFHAR